jgi:hypothetical protein
VFRFRDLSHGASVLIRTAEAKQLCTKAELDVYTASLSRSIKKLSEKELKGGVTRSRRARDKYRSLAERQKRESRGKQGAKGKCVAGIGTHVSQSGSVWPSAQSLRNANCFRDRHGQTIAGSFQNDSQVSRQEESDIEKEGCQEEVDHQEGVEEKDCSEKSCIEKEGVRKDD